MGSAQAEGRVSRRSLELEEKLEKQENMSRISI
jgi:hypothetical protein